MGANSPDFYEIAFDETLTFYTYEMSCTFEQREAENCTEEFHKQGFFRDSVWDRAAEYRHRCHACPHFPHHIGFYYGNGHYTDDFSGKETFCIPVKDTADLNEVVAHLPRGTKALWLSSDKATDYAALATLPELETVWMGVSERDVLWDMRKTPRLTVLELLLGRTAPDLSGLVHASGLRHLGFMTHVSQVVKTVVPSWSFLKEMPALDSLVLSSVTSADADIQDLIDIPHLKRLWISPHMFTTEEYARFEAVKFKIFEEYGIFAPDNDYVRPLGKGGRVFQSEQGKERFIKKYRQMMEKYLPKT